MKYPRFSRDKELIGTVRSLSKKLQSFLSNMTSTMFFYDIIGSVTSCSIYFYFMDFAHKDMCIRISNHISNSGFYNSDNCYNIIVKDKKITNENINKEFEKILSWIKSREEIIKADLENVI